MATLTVKNVGPIREADIEVRKHTIFIGPQGTGKSTLAKLIAILSSEKSGQFSGKIFNNYNILSYINPSSVCQFKSLRFQSALEQENISYSVLDEKGQIRAQSLLLRNEESKPNDWPEDGINVIDQLQKAFEDDPKNFQFVRDLMLRIDNSRKIWLSSGSVQEVYAPADRLLISILTDAIWSLTYSKTNIPESVTLFGRYVEEARNAKDSLRINFLNINYVRSNGQDLVEYESGKFISLSQSASGYQSIIPLLLVVEHQRQENKRRFVIEEPELNLYPTAQKDLIYSLVGGLDPEKEYQDAEWVITTHSPYVLTSYNMLMLAYKVAQRNDELRAEVDKIIPSRYWINPDDFAAYYVDNGTARSITSEKTGMINGSELDNVSDDFADVQDKIMALSRSVARV